MVVAKLTDRVDQLFWQSAPSISQPSVPVSGSAGDIRITIREEIVELEERRDSLIFRGITADINEAALIIIKDISK